MFRTIQAVALSLGIVAHVAVWVYELRFATDSGWLCEEISCWFLLAADMPISHLYATSNESVTWGSLTVGSLWWGLMACGVANLFFAARFAFRREVRQAARRALQTARGQIAGFWISLSFVALIASGTWYIQLFSAQQ